MTSQGGATARNLHFSFTEFGYAYQKRLTQIHASQPGGGTSGKHLLITSTSRSPRWPAGDPCTGKVLK